MRGAGLNKRGYGGEEQVGRGFTVAHLMALLHSFSITDPPPVPPPTPQARALPKSKWEEQQRTPTAGYQGCC